MDLLEGRFFDELLLITTCLGTDACMVKQLFFAARLYRKDNVNRNPATAKNTKQTSVAEIKKKLEQKSEAASTKHSPANPWNLRGSGDRAIPDSGTLESSGVPALS